MSAKDARNDPRITNPIASWLAVGCNNIIMLLVDVIFVDFIVDWAEPYLVFAWFALGLFLIPMAYSRFKKKYVDGNVKP